MSQGNFAVLTLQSIGALDFKALKLASKDGLLFDLMSNQGYLGYHPLM